MSVSNCQLLAFPILALLLLNSGDLAHRPADSNSEPAAFAAPISLAPDPASPAPDSHDQSVTASVDASNVLVSARAETRGAGKIMTASMVEFRRMTNRSCQLVPTGFFQVEVPGPDPSTSSCLQLGVACPPGQTPLQALYRRDSPGAEWVLVEQAGCAVDLAAAVGQEFARLPLAGSTITIQPPGGNTLVNLDTIVFTDGATQNLTATVLGTPVTIRAYPIRYSWDFGDAKEPLVTTDLGHPYPDQTLTRPYDKAGTYTITLTTTWRGEYRTTGTTDWLPVTGTATTVTTAPPLTAHEAHSHLVDGPLP
jgi:hypothetical protein